MGLDKINHIITLMLENRSFDTILGKLYPHSASFDGLTGDESNPDAHGQAVRVNNRSNLSNEALCVPTPDPGELYTDINEQVFGARSAQVGDFNRPTMDGFVTNYLRQTDEPAGSYRADAVMHYFTPEQVPVISGLARQFAVCDRWFASAPCQTWPNRFFAHTGTAGGYENNKPAALYQMPSIFEKLHESIGSESWRIYFHDIAQSMALANLWKHPRHFCSFNRFLTDASTGNLPNYAFIEPSYFPDYDPPNDQHPPHNVSLGESLIADVYNALRNGPAWASTLLIITYDEHGGCYDHVAPPKATPPGPKTYEPFNFDRYGVRVPTVLVSPCIKPGTVLRPYGDIPFDHTSIIATVRKRFGLTQPLSHRDEVAPDVGGVLNLEQPDNVGPQRVSPIKLESTRALAEQSRSKQVTGLQRSLLALSRTLPESGEDIKSPVEVNARRRSTGEATAAFAQIAAGEAAPEVKRRVNRFLAVGEPEISPVPRMRGTEIPPPTLGRPGTEQFVPTQLEKKKKLAFVIGNAAYAFVAPLQNSSADANAMREKLTKFGFDVYGGTNCGLSELRDWFDAFVRLIQKDDTVLLHYSGHGVQINGQNYLVPIDASLAVLQQLDEAIRLQGLMDRVMSAQARRCVVLIDACRDNPFIAGDAASEGARRIEGVPQVMAITLASRGLAPLEVAADVQAFIAFAAEPGKFAYEGIGPYGRFTGAVIDHLETRGLTIDGLMQRVSADVKTATDGKQRPWTQSNLSERFSFNPASWAPVLIMAMLGALSGVVSAYFGFKNAELQACYPVGLIFGGVVGYGIWKWGRGTVWAAGLATIIAALTWAVDISIMQYFHMFDPLMRSHIEKAAFFDNTYVMRDTILSIIGGSLYVLACVLGGAITTPSLRRTPIIGMALLSGILVALIYVCVTELQKLAPSIANNSFLEYGAIFLGAALWQGLLGASIGYGLSAFVPDPLERNP